MTIIDIYFNLKVTLSIHIRITLCIIVQSISITTYFELKPCIIRITTYFELKPCINSN